MFTLGLALLFTLIIPSAALTLICLVVHMLFGRQKELAMVAIICTIFSWSMLATIIIVLALVLDFTHRKTK